ncbi:polysaccharide deacetylase family protein, partial [Candidatus Sumerlaeota bacterium]|nr:polysaccharide deacetylase family protein [Candidatus Sumerlaeota bacterium]
MSRTIILCADCEGTHRQLADVVECIDRLGIAVNFFFVGETARSNPEIVRHVAERHQVESHTMTHTPLRGLQPEAQHREIMEGKDQVEQIIGRPTHGFRAPCHAIDRRTVTILNDEGFIFDVSGLYYRYHMGNVIEIRPTWFREWMPLYGRLGITPRFAMRLFRLLFRLFNPLVIPLHPHYTALDSRHLRAFEEFVQWAYDRGGEFVLIRDWLAQRDMAYDPALPL